MKIKWKSRGVVAGLMCVMMPLFLVAQSDANRKFHPPLDIPLVVSGTYGDMRVAHFHFGVDYKTQQVENKRVYSIDSGYVSRVKISPYGYGKALYITHPSGIVSVYAHLNGFNSQVEKEVRVRQYEQRSFAVDIDFPPNRLPVRRGEFIGLSGNTGTSGGPHLHFEIRDAVTEHTLNPFDYGFTVSDKRPPVLSALKLYPAGTSGRVQGRCDEWESSLLLSGGRYRIRGGDTLRAKGSFYVGLLTWDLLDGAANRCGVYSVQMLLNGKEVLGYQMNRMSFDESRFYLALLDYPEARKSGRRFLTSRIEPNNRKMIYTQKVENGIIGISEGEVHRIELVVSDWAGNRSRLEFVVVHDANDYPPCGQPCPNDRIISWERDFLYALPGAGVRIPAGTAFDTCCFLITSSAGSANLYSPVYSIGNPDIPLFAYYDINLKPNRLPHDSLLAKLLLVELDNAKVTARGGIYDSGFVRGRVRAFANYALMIDTVPPTVRPQGWSDGATFPPSRRQLRFTVSDDLSGVESWNAWLNDEWILLEYDPKTRRMTYSHPHNFSPGNYSIRLKVKDERGNANELVIRVTVK